MHCVIDLIAKKEEKAFIVFENDFLIAFLDKHPLFPGHTLLAPKAHFETFYDLPLNQLSDFFSQAQRIGKAIEEAMGAEGSFLAMNNQVSQSIPHLHLHIVPRKKGDGLKGFFWPRTRYRDEVHQLETLEKIKACLR